MDCPICKLPINDSINRWPCCGVLICKDCSFFFKKERELNFIIDLYCPMCRSPLPKNDRETFSCEIKHALAGKTWAMISVGRHYSLGRGCEKNLEKSFQYFQMAASAGDAVGLVNLGICYDVGEGIDQSFEDACYYYQLAARKGNAQAQHLLAQCYLEGTGVASNVVTALYYYTLAAEQGYKDSIYTLAMIYRDGEIIEESYAEAMYWFKKFLCKENEKDSRYLSVQNYLNQTLLFMSSFCSNCNKKGNQKMLIPCMNCASTYYCNTECLSNHYHKEGGHKDECKQS